MKRKILAVLGALAVSLGLIISAPGIAHADLTSTGVGQSCFLPGTDNNVRGLLRQVFYGHTPGSNPDHNSSSVNNYTTASNQTVIENYTTNQVVVRVRTYTPGTSYNSGWWTIDGRNSGGATLPGVYDSITLPVVQASEYGEWYVYPGENPVTIVDYRRASSQTVYSLSLWHRNRLDFGPNTQCN